MTGKVYQSDVSRDYWQSVAQEQALEQDRQYNSGLRRGFAVFAGILGFTAMLLMGNIDRASGEPGGVNCKPAVGNVADGVNMDPLNMYPKNNEPQVNGLKANDNLSQWQQQQRDPACQQ